MYTRTHNKSYKVYASISTILRTVKYLTFDLFMLPEAACTEFKMTLVEFYPYCVSDKVYFLSRSIH